MILTIAKAELRRMFYSPLAWATLAVVLFILGLLFLILVDNYLTTIQAQLVGIPGAPGVTDIVLAPVMLWAGVIMLTVSPLQTMRAFSEERQQGSLTLLTSAPLSTTELVLGKYLALLVFILVLLGLLALIPLSLAGATQLDWGKIMASLLGLFLLLASFSAAGLFISSQTKTPLIAAMSSFGLLMFLVVLYMSGSAESTASDLFIYLSHFGHLLPFLQGLFDSSDLIYYLLFSAAFLILTIRRLDNERLQR
ncbi:MAG TPA: ABC transporter permease subunit [Gammaproteobacteria bacterium]|jgi:ABC-2 type transport system permease protein|nr:ABC transporter permease subunit [Gammaproteobacteria bacterium]